LLKIFGSIFNGLMIYTCYEMIQDCRAGKPEGREYFATHYVPMIRHLLAHYVPAQASDVHFVEKTVKALCMPGSRLFESQEPAPERTFVTALRQHLLEAVAANFPEPDIRVDLDALAQALDEMTVLERQAVWMETMRYGTADAARMLRMQAQSVERIRQRAAERLRGVLDQWSSAVLTENGPALASEAASRATAECRPAKDFLDVIDGRMTWRGREEIDSHVRLCWNCLDHFCRLLETTDLLRASSPLPEEELESFRRVLEVPAGKRPLWKRIFAG